MTDLSNLHAEQLVLCRGGEGKCRLASSCARHDHEMIASCLMQVEDYYKPSTICSYYITKSYNEYEGEGW